MTLTLAATVAAGLALFLWKSRRNYIKLPVLPCVSGQAVDPASLAIIIPARNEEANIQRVVSSLQPYGVFVVDDDSSDRTAELAVAAGAEVLEAPPLKRGMMGKPNACLAGAKATISEWILFVDADTYYEPDFIPSLLTYAQAEKLDMVSCFLRQRCDSFAEKLLLPYSFALYFCGVNGDNVNSPKSMEALANGQCMLFRRSVYDFIGGHAAVSSSVVEDVQLALIAKRHRIRQRVLRAEHLGTVRMYEGFGAIWRGFEKNSFRFLLINRWTGAQVVLSSILLTSYLPILAFLLWNNRHVEAAVFAVLPGIFLLPWYRSPMAFLSPIAIYAFQLIALSGMLATAHGRSAVWKGRKV
jgi:chlorobactene glucosyltransferase